MPPIRTLAIALPLLALTACGGSGGGDSHDPATTAGAAPRSSPGLLALEVVSIRGSGPAQVTSDLGADRDRALDRWRFDFPGSTGLPAQILISATDLANGGNTSLAITTHLD